MQKIILHTSLLKDNNPTPDKPTFVLSLPEEEMHEIGLLYLNYELKLKGYHTIYIGRSISIQDLKRVGIFFPLIIWVSVFTMKPLPKRLSSYLKEIQLMLEHTQNEHWVIGKSLNNIPKNTNPLKIKTFLSVEDTLSHLNVFNDSLS